MPVTTRTAPVSWLPPYCRVPSDAPRPAHRIFLLSPADCGGTRADLLMRERAAFPLAVRLRSAGGVTLGEAFSFLSGLYFRGKLAYAECFGRAPEGLFEAMVITTNRGLVSAGQPIDINDLREFGRGEIHSGNPDYRVPLSRDVARLAARDDVDVVLLGSIATGKYVDVLLEALGERLRFPGDFVGRGDMSRGALLLRAVREGLELEYQVVARAIRRGRRPSQARGATE